MQKLLEISLGIVLVTLGIIGGLLPVLQGWVFMIPGLFLLSRHIPFVRRMLDRGLDVLERWKPVWAANMRERLHRYEREQAEKLRRETKVD